MKLTALFCAAVAAGACSAQPSDKPAATELHDARFDGLTTIGTSPGGSVFYFDPSSVKDVADSNGGAALREAIVITDNRAFAEASGRPDAPVASRNTVVLRCDSREMRISKATVTKQDGTEETTSYTERHFAFAQAPEGRFEGRIIETLCAQ